MTKQDEHDVTLFSTNDPTIFIDLKKDEKCTIIGLKLSHTGNKCIKFFMIIYKR